VCGPEVASTAFAEPSSSGQQQLDQAGRGRFFKTQHQPMGTFGWIVQAGVLFLGEVDSPATQFLLLGSIPSLSCLLLAAVVGRSGQAGVTCRAPRRAPLPLDHIEVGEIRWPVSTDHCRRR